MGEKYSLIQRLNSPEKKTAASLLPTGVKYNTHTILVDNEEIEVFIPLRESDAFETAVEKNGKYLNRDDFRTLMREHRGIQNRE